ncbi:autoinducer binding domain-containing protein [Pseudomonas maumuensis]|uniref:Autoinducer binding domain-containing protein n=1 Tax=Pseudomonas maumuensis TaxID=2842354 RepID=A0ABX8NMZ1_9PSED|nr:autoinducer binding domain-containing protein [Pseudomonas maumuensis]QXH57366.1 autoinducer binding domain-containing protein [Pseudomonas maumuensis]
MPHWKSEQLQRMLEEKEPQQLFGHAVKLAQALGMEFVGLSLHLHVAARGPQVILYNNYPSAWNEHYQAEDFIKIDPAVSKCHQTTLPLVWSDELFREVPHLREAACGHGLVHGWSQSVHDQQHNESQLSVSRAQGAICHEELYEKSAQVMWLCNILHAALSTHHLAKFSPPPQLSERELEVLKWSAAGKTAADVAMILSLSPSTVNFHIRSVITKTNASNKAGAIAIAALRGLL